MGNKKWKAYTERGGFEPPEPEGSTVFETVRIDRSRIFPEVIIHSGSQKPVRDWAGLNRQPSAPQANTLIQLSYSLISSIRKRQELNLPSPYGTDGLAIRCITALPRFQVRSERDSNPRNLAAQ